MLNVFLVEDEVVIRDGLRDNFPWEQYGFQLVGEAADGEMALPMIRRLKPDILITDIKMPFMDGLSLSKIVHEEFPKTRIVIISGYDDFEYARQAIEVGVEQYLLKPITRLAIRKTLTELKEKIEQEVEQSDYQAQFQSDMHVYEQFARRSFMEKALSGELPVREIFEEASRLSIDISAPCYNLLFFFLREKSGGGIDGQTENFLRRQDEILYYFLRYPQYLLFRWNVNCYGVLVKGEPSVVRERTKNGVDHIRRLCEPEEELLEWYVAVGDPVERLSQLCACYRDVNHYLAYRFIMPELHVLSRESLGDELTQQGENRIDSVDSSTMSQEIIRDFLAKGTENEIHDFVDSYLQGLRETLKSRMFRAYVVLNIRFTAIAYVESIGGSQEEYMKRVGNYAQEMNLEAAEVPEYFENMLRAAIAVREDASSSQNKKMLSGVLDYIDAHFAEESLSLNRVAAEVQVSPNYLSTVFSQTMKKTFVEYVTGKRMEKARQLLRTTGLSNGEIALETGYRDSHYFSFVFKKTQGMSPREYRSGKRGQKRG